MSEPRLCIASHAAESDYAPTSRMLLWKLGYELVAPEHAHEPALRVVRDDRLSEVAAQPNAPIILLTRGRRTVQRDPRVAGTLRPPAGLHELYRLIQVALEEHPRSVPRAPTLLRATGTTEAKRFEFAVTSLSECGCLVSSLKPPLHGARLDVEIELPWGERLSTPAIVAYEQGECLGLVFHGITLGARKKVAKAVMELLARA